MALLPGAQGGGGRPRVGLGPAHDPDVGRRGAELALDRGEPIGHGDGVPLEVAAGIDRRPEVRAPGGVPGKGAPGAAVGQVALEGRDQVTVRRHGRAVLRRSAGEVRPGPFERGGPLGHEPLPVGQADLRLAGQPVALHLGQLGLPSVGLEAGGLGRALVHARPVALRPL